MLSLKGDIPCCAASGENNGEKRQEKRTGLFSAFLQNSQHVQVRIPTTARQPWKKFFSGRKILPNTQLHLMQSIIKQLHLNFLKIREITELDRKVA